MLRVFLNDALQLAYYWPIDLKSELQLDSGRFFMGLTGATGLTGQRQVITNWNLRRVAPSSRNSFSAMIQGSRDVESGKEFEVGVFLRTKCSTPYIPFEFDYESWVKVNWMAVDDCTLIKVFAKQAPSGQFPSYGTSSYVALVRKKK